MLSIDIIVPIYNEKKCVEELVKRIQKACPEGKITFIDNASTDGTLEILDKMEAVSVIHHQVNEGYGKSLIDGINETSGEKIVIIDADLEYPPEAIAEVNKELDNHDAVFGSRFYDGSDIDMSAFRSLGNRTINVIFNFLYSKNLTDLYTGIRGFRREALSGMDFDRHGFEFVLEISCKLAKKSFRFKEVAIIYNPRSTGKSKMKHIPEALKFAFWILYYRVLG